MKFDLCTIKWPFDTVRLRQARAPGPLYATRAIDIAVLQTAPMDRII